MAQNTAIEWTDNTWNPVTGCTKISSGCEHCYAERLALRLKAMGSTNYRNGFSVTLQPRLLDLPLKWRKPRNVFVNSMSDLFHNDVPLDYIQRVFNIMTVASHHRFQVLTKRADRLTEIADRLSWPSNVYMGVSVENANHMKRIDLLREVPAVVRFVSFEPLLGAMPGLDLSGIQWVIVGGESGPDARPIKKQWITDIRDRCIEHEIPFFFKQWGGVNKKQAGRLLDGKVWDQMPKSQSQAHKTSLAL